MTDTEAGRNPTADEEEVQATTTTPVDEGGEESFNWKTHVIGDYDYIRLCKPRLNPWKKDNQEPLPFYKKDDRLAWLLAAFLGFQHSLAVVGGTVIPGILLGNQDPSGKAGPYLVSYALLTSGTWDCLLCVSPDTSDPLTHLPTYPLTHRHLHLDPDYAYSRSSHQVLCGQWHVVCDCHFFCLFAHDPEFD